MIFMPLRLNILADVSSASHSPVVYCRSGHFSERADGIPGPFYTELEPVHPDPEEDRALQRSGWRVLSVRAGTWAVLERRGKAQVIFADWRIVEKGAAL